MGGRRIARIGVVAGVAVTGAAVAWWQMGGGSVDVSPDVALKPGVTATATGSGGKIAKDLEVDLYQQLRDGDAAQKQQAAKTLADLVASQPYQIIEDLPKWLKPLMEAQLYAQVLEFTEKGIPLHAHNTAAVSDQQRARAEALLILGEHERALSEAKSAFNVSAQKTADRTISLLIEALNATRQATDPGIVERFERQQIAGAQLLETDEPNVLQSIEVDATAYTTAIESLSGTSSSYDEFMAAGNLLLIADRASEARDAFRRAASVPDTKGKKLFAALEGIVRAERAEHGSIGHANAMVEAMKFGATASAHLRPVSDLSLPIEGLQSAGRAIAAAALPEGMREQAAAVSIAEGAMVDLRGRMENAKSIVTAAVPTDPDIVRWLERVEGAGQLSDALRSEISPLIAHTPLHIEALFQLATAFDLASGDRASTVFVYAALADRVSATPQDASPSDRASLALLLNSSRDVYIESLWLAVFEDRPPIPNLALQTIIKLNEAFLVHCPDDDELVRRREWVKFDLARCYYRLGEFARGAELLDSIAVEMLNPGERLLVRWQKSAFLYQMERFEEAIPHIRAALAWEGFPDRPEGLIRLASCLQKLGRSEEAGAVMAEYRDRFEPTR